MADCLVGSDTCTLAFSSLSSSAFASGVIITPPLPSGSNDANISAFLESICFCSFIIASFFSPSSSAICDSISAFSFGVLAFFNDTPSAESAIVEVSPIIPPTPPASTMPLPNSLFLS